MIPKIRKAAMRIANRILRTSNCDMISSFDKVSAQLMSKLSMHVSIAIYIQM